MTIATWNFRIVIPTPVYLLALDSGEQLRIVNDDNNILADGFEIYSVLSSSKSPFDNPLLSWTDLASGALRKSLEGNGAGFMRVRVVSSLSNSSLPSSE